MGEREAAISVKGNTVTITFKGTPNYVQWQNLMWNLPMISPAAGQGDHQCGEADDVQPERPIGTGPYKVGPRASTRPQRVVYTKNANGGRLHQGVSPSPKPKYIIDLVNTSNTNSLTRCCTGVEDLNNNYLPGVNSLVQQGKVSTYYPSRPVHALGEHRLARAEHDACAAERSGLPPGAGRGDQRQPGRDAGLRATSCGRRARPGLLPTWNKYVDKQRGGEVRLQVLAEQGQALLDEAGYQGLVRQLLRDKDGSNRSISICPFPRAGLTGRPPAT